MEQETDAGNEMRAIATAIRELQSRAKRADQPTLAYLLDMAAVEAEWKARHPDEGG